MLRQALESGTSRRVHAVRTALGFEGLWPHATSLQPNALKSFGVSGPGTSPLPGVAWLVSVEANRVAALWQLHPTSKNPSAERSFVGTAMHALHNARRQALRDLPLVVTLRCPTALSWRAELAIRDPVDTQLPGALDGPSYGLAMCLAYASLALGIALPPQFLASAEVLPDGTLRAVDDLPLKIRAVVDLGLGITTLLVAPSQKAEVEALLADAADALHGRVIEVVDPRSLYDAFERVFPRLDDRVAAQWSAADGSDFEASRCLDELWRTTLVGDHDLLSWRGVANAGRVLEARFAQGDPTSARRAAIVHAIADRHEGGGAVLSIERDEVLAALPRPLWLRYLAHAVQSAADLDHTQVPRYVDFALREIAPERHRFPEDLRVQGAVARALASVGELERAETLLRETVESWFELELEHEATYAISEWIRVAGLRKQRGVLECIERDLLPRAVLDPRTSEISRAYHGHALGMAWFHADDPTRAIAAFDDVELRWDVAPLALSRRRWRARAVAKRDGREQANTLRDEVVREGEGRPEALLVMLDRALEDDDNEGWSRAIGALLAHPWGAEARRVARLLGIEARQEPSRIERTHAETFVWAYRY
jgi:hypothetical protein